MLSATTFYAVLLNNRGNAMCYFILVLCNAAWIWINLDRED